MNFHEHAYEKLIDLYRNHEHEVGSELQKTDPITYGSYKSTNCITYVMNVLSHAFESIGDAKAAQHVWTLAKHGTELAQYLVTKHGWKGIYINPDVNHPRDAPDPRCSEHPYSHYLANKTCKYYKIPLHYKVINYTPTPKDDPAFQQLNEHLSETALNNIDIAGLEKVKFGFGVSRGGMHTWVYAEGYVYEVHWNAIGADLYEAMPLRLFPWLSGAIVIPPDLAGVIPASAKLSCAS
jgi:hypothetical protein